MKSNRCTLYIDTRIVIEKYKQLHDVVVVDGMDTFENVFNTLSNEIENGFKNLR